MKKHTSLRKSVLSIAILVLFLVSITMLVNASQNATAKEGIEPQSVTSSWGQFQTIAFGSEYGCFEIIPDNDRGGEIVYYDFNSLTIRNLAKTDPRNGAIVDLMGGSTPVIAGENLYVFKTGHPLDQFSAGYESSIMKMDFDGSNRKILRLSETETFDYGMVAYDGTNLTFIVYDWTLDGRVKSISLCEADFTREKIKKITNFKGMDLVNIVGVYSEGLILQFVESKPAISADIEPEVKITYKLFSLAENKLKNMRPWWTEGTWFSYVIAKNDAIYFSLDGNSELYCYDINTEESYQLSRDLDFNKENAAVQLTNIFDDHITYNLDVDGITYSCAIDLESLKCFMITLPYVSEVEENRKVEIYGETADSFFIRCGLRYEPYDYTFPDGVVVTNIAQIFDYALISKADYWSSTPSYRIFV